MQKTPVTSSNIEAVGYDPGLLRIWFKNGSAFDYAGVTPEEYESLIQAGSIGKHFNAEIKSKYTGGKVVDDNHSVVEQR